MSANEPLGAAPAARSGVRFVVGLAIATILGAATGALLSNDSIGLSIYPLFFCAFAIGCCVPRHAWLCGAIILPIQESSPTHTPIST